jgi:hypothetical protein
MNSLYIAFALISLNDVVRKFRTNQNFVVKIQSRSSVGNCDFILEVHYYRELTNIRLSLTAFSLQVSMASSPQSALVDCFFPRMIVPGFYECYLKSVIILST